MFSSAKPTHSKRYRIQVVCGYCFPLVVTLVTAITEFLAPRFETKYKLFWRQSLAPRFETKYKLFWRQSLAPRSETKTKLEVAQVVNVILSCNFEYLGHFLTNNMYEFLENQELLTFVSK
jgi:hypothetical protein